MKAIVCTKYGPPEFLQLREVDKPAPEKGEVLIKIYTTAVTASDCIIRGLNASPGYRIAMRLAIGFTKPRNPILGMVYAGEVESTGVDVKSFKVGDQVFGFNRFKFGTYAEYKTEPESGVIAAKPSNVTFEQAAAIPYGGMLALHYLKKGNIQNGDNVLIYGAPGAVGTLAVQLARHFGAQVSGVCSTANLELVKSLGASTVIDYTKEDVTNREEQYDFIFDAVGKRKSSKTKLQIKNMLTPEGKYISVDEGSPKLDVESLTFLKELAEAGVIKAVIDRTYPFEQMPEAHAYVDKGHKKGNVVITVAHNNT